jgi:hypothetical protein
MSVVTEWSSAKIFYLVDVAFHFNRDEDDREERADWECSSEECDISILYY